MLFHSVEFLIFLPVVLLGHALLRGRALRWWLVAMSYVFYGWGYPPYCLLLLTSTVLDFFVAQRIQAQRSRRAKRAWLMLSLTGNLGLLGTFKYLGFATHWINRLSEAAGAGALVPIVHLALPVGISFYTFQTMAYTVDVYRGRMPATRNFSTMALYVAFFPQLVAGPIERAQHLMPQVAARQPRTSDDILAGGTRILWGLMKKVVFADWLALYVTQVYGSPGQAAEWELLLATYAFACQIYLDFSAYSDIAIGIARTMGIRLRENFRWPYLARNLSEFWQRWHISLSTWLRDYLYIPLGGSRGSTARTLRNLLIVMVLGGLWHGAANTYILWGLWIGLGLAVFHGYERLVPGERGVDTAFRWRDIAGILITFHWVLVSWVFFRSQTISEALGILGRILSPWERSEFTIALEITLRSAILVGVVGLVHVVRGLGVGRWWQVAHPPWRVGVLWGILVVIMAVGFAPAQEPFIYFKF